MISQTSLAFSMSPTACIQKAQDYFVSENFTSAFDILRNSFDENYVKDELLLDLLTGKTGFSVSDNDVTFDPKFLIEDEEQADYAQTVSEVLENYDFLFSKNDTIYQAYNHFDFNLNLIADSNDWIKELKANENVLLSSKQFKYFDEIKKLMRENSCFFLDDADCILYSDATFYFFKKYNAGYYVEFCKTYNTAIEAAVSFKKSREYY